MLTNEVSIAPNGGKEFGPRHLDFHPTKPWMYVSIETQNKMYMYRIEKDGINPEIPYRSETLAEPNNIRARQAAGTVHVHPNGRFVYGANRAEATTEFQGKQVFKGGENSIVVLRDQSIHRRAHTDPAPRDPKGLLTIRRVAPTPNPIAPLALPNLKGGASDARALAQRHELGALSD